MQGNRRRTRLRRWLLPGLGLAALLLVLGLAVVGQADRDPVPDPQLTLATAATYRVDFAHEDVGAYHSVGPKGRPAWWISRDPGLVKQFGFGHDGVVLVRCDCGLVIRMLGQVVDADGTVTPSIWHDVPACGYHVYGKFDGWDAGRWDTAGKGPAAASKP